MTALAYLVTTAWKNLVRELHSCSPALLYPSVHLEYTRYQRLACIREESLPTSLAAKLEA